MIFAIISAFFFVSIWIVKKLYELHKPTQKYIQTFSKVRIYRFIGITFISYFGQGFIFIWGISRFIILITSFIILFLLFLFDQIRNFLEKKTQKNSNYKILIITNDKENSYNAIQKIKDWFDFKTELIETKNIKNTKLQDYFMIIAIWNFEKNVLQNIFEKIRLSNTRFYHISEWYFLEDVVYKPENINNIIALEYKHSQLDWRSLVLKRILDIIGSITLLILTFPIMIIVAITIKLDSKWPIFYKQKRVGKNKKLLNFTKFRTMYFEDCIGDNYWWKKALEKQQKLINSDANIRKWELQKIKDDPRITKVWKFLRKTSLDELPNLFSVIIGTMSLAGPRPHLPNEISKYKPRQERLLSIKPGITGYAQIFGRDNISFDDEARLDLYYIQRRSIFLDIYIIFATIKVMFKWR